MEERNLCIEQPLYCGSELSSVFDWTDWIELGWLVSQIATKLIEVI